MAKVIDLCKICKHVANSHCMTDPDNLWSTQYICIDCDYNVCIFEGMTNLDYLEWKNEK